MMRLIPKPRARRFAALGLLCAVAAAGFADRLTDAWVEHRTAEAFQEATGAAGPTSVHVGGIPVLTQVLSGQLAHVDLSSGEIPASGSRPVPITGLSLHLNGLRAYGNAQAAHVDSVRGTASLSYRDLSDSLGLQIRPDRDPGRVDATADVPLLGQVTVSAELAVAGPTGIAFRDPRVVGDLPPGVASMVTRALEQPLTLRNLPQGLKLQGLTTDASGVNVDLTGRDVTFTPDSGAGTSDTRV